MHMFKHVQPLRSPGSPSPTPILYVYVVSVFSLLNISLFFARIARCCLARIKHQLLLVIVGLIFGQDHNCTLVTHGGTGSPGLCSLHCADPIVISK